ncbi:hypothetical protein HK096_001724 [Nowakowskiella sp. JEL0078]|nr:hypothetical protein HK096_001724 [Nowakowskiella sp. JEL0078]
MVLSGAKLTCVFYHKDDKEHIIGIYVDDTMIIGDPHQNNSLIKKIKNKIDISRDEDISFFTRIQIDTLDPNTLLLSQRAYAKKIFERFGMQKSQAVSTPYNKVILVNRKMVGSLIPTLLIGHSEDANSNYMGLADG